MKFALAVTCICICAFAVISPEHCNMVLYRACSEHHVREGGWKVRHRKKGLRHPLVSFGWVGWSIGQPTVVLPLLQLYCPRFLDVCCTHNLVF